MKKVLRNTKIMKTILLLFLTISFSTPLLAQEGNQNTMSVQVNDVTYETQPRRVKIGRYGYITGNSINPDISLRIWFGSYDGQDLNEPGKYLIIGEDENYKKDDSLYAAYLTGDFKGLAYIKYVEETKSPRMEYHVGESKYKGETVDVTLADDGYLEVVFEAQLEGSIWKEKAGATAFGGLGRLQDKLTNKAVTGASGYEQNIDPEGDGYKKQKELDTITLKNGIVRIKIE